MYRPRILRFDFIIENVIKMKKLLVISLLGLAGVASAADFRPFIGVDFASERDTLKNDYLNSSVTVGVKGPDRMEYSLRMGGTQREGDTYSRNVEARVKKSFDLGMPFVPYAALRIGQKTNNYGDRASLTHVAADAGMRIDVARQVALDLGVRYRDATTRSVNYQSTRYHAAVLYELNPANVVGLRYTTSNSTNRPQEERNGWRVSYQHNF